MIALIITRKEELLALQEKLARLTNEQLNAGSLKTEEWHKQKEKEITAAKAQVRTALSELRSLERQQSARPK